MKIAKISFLIKGKLFENIFSLSLLQFFNYILPFFTFPYLTRVLGIEKFGIIMFSQSLIQYFILLTDYGFNLSATRDIAINREDKHKVNRIFLSVFFVKIILLVISFLLLAILLILVHKFRQYAIIHLLTFGIVVGNVLFPTWLFQGLEYMKYIAFLNSVMKIVVTFLTFLLIKEQNDYYMVPLLNSIGSIIIGISAFIIAIKRFDLSLKSFPNFKEDVLKQFKDGWNIFVSIFSTSLYTGSNTLILGFVTNDTVVGYYSSIDKIIKSINSLYTPFSQAVFPYLTNLIQKNKFSAIRFLKYFSLILGLGSFLLSLSILIFRKEIVQLIMGDEFVLPVNLLAIFSFLPFLLVVTNILGTLILLAFNFQRIFSISLVIPSIVHLILSLIITPQFNVYGLALLALFTELFIIILRLIGVLKNKSKIFSLGVDSR